MSRIMSPVLTDPSQSLTLDMSVQCATVSCVFMLPTVAASVCVNSSEGTGCRRTGRRGRWLCAEGGGKTIGRRCVPQTLRNTTTDVAEYYRGSSAPASARLARLACSLRHSSAVTRPTINTDNIPQWRHEPTPLPLAAPGGVAGLGGDGRALSRIRKRCP